MLLMWYDHNANILCKPMSLELSAYCSIAKLINF